MFTRKVYESVKIEIFEKFVKESKDIIDINLMDTSHVQSEVEGNV